MEQAVGLVPPPKNISKGVKCGFAKLPVCTECNKTILIHKKTRDLLICTKCLRNLNRKSISKEKDSRTYYKRNREIILAKSKIAEIKERNNLSHKKRYQAMTQQEKELYSERKKKYYWANKEVLLAKGRERYIKRKQEKNNE